MRIFVHIHIVFMTSTELSSCSSETRYINMKAGKCKYLLVKTHCEYESAVILFKIVDKMLLLQFIWMYESARKLLIKMIQL